jgi:hypothetical protein
MTLTNIQKYWLRCKSCLSSVSANGYSDSNPLSFLFLAEIRRAEMLSLVLGIYKVVSDRKDKQVLSDRAQIHC